MIQNCKYLSCEICYENKKDIEQNLAKYSQTFEILSNTFKPRLVRKCSRIKLHNGLVLPILLYVGEIWTLSKKKTKTDISRDEIFQKNSWVHHFYTTTPPKQ
jgi:hypothetical protein